MKTYNNPQRITSKPIQYDPRSTSPIVTRQKKGFSTYTPIQTAPFYPLEASQTKLIYSNPKLYNQNIRTYQQNQQYSYQPPFRQEYFNQRKISSQRVMPYYNRSQYQRSQHNQTWSKIQTLLSKPVHYPNQIAYNQFGYKQKRETAEDNYGIKINYNVQAANQTRENYHKYFTRQQGLVLKQIRNHSYSKVLSPQQYEQYKKIGLLSQYKSQQIKKIPKTTSRIEYIPYYRKVYDYEPRQIVDYIYVPVQKTALQHYSIQHVIDFEKREYYQTVLENIPQQRVRMRLQYIPIQQHILYVPQESLDSVQQRLKSSSMASSKVKAFQQGQFVNGSFASLHAPNQSTFHQASSNIVMKSSAKKDENTINISSRAVKQDDKIVQNHGVIESGSFVNKSIQVPQKQATISNTALQDKKQYLTLTSNDNTQKSKYLREEDKYELNNGNYNNVLPQSDQYQVKYPSFSGSFYTNQINIQMQNEINDAKKNLNSIDSYQQLGEKKQPSSPSKAISPQKNNNEAQIQIK